jgi:hypothetical protein
MSQEEEVNTTNPIPSRIFIVPYRNRLHHKFFFCNQMKFLLEGSTDYEIYFVHQSDSRPFNRGATKNIGFLAMKSKYPNDYKNISFIFNDVDSVPFHRLFDYQTVEGIVKHHYGFETSLGGIVVITGADFEKINGYPNFWGWGMEDTCLQKRCNAYNIQVDRSEFYPIGSPEILQLFDGVSRLVSSRDPKRMKTDTGLDGISTIRDLKYTVDSKSSRIDDNIYVVTNPRIFVVNVASFLTLIRFDDDKYHEYDLREPVRNIPFSDKPKTNNIVATPNTWKNIPYYPMNQKPPSPPLQQQQQYQQQQQSQQYQQQVRNAIAVHQHAGKYAYQKQQQPASRIGLGGLR